MGQVKNTCRFEDDLHRDGLSMFNFSYNFSRDSVIADVVYCIGVSVLN